MAARRDLLRGGAVAAALAGAIPFGRFMPSGYRPVALAQEAPSLATLGKSSALVILGDRPLVAETPAHLLDDEVTPSELHFIRNNGAIPDPPGDPDAWRLTVDGEVATPLELTLAELRSRFETVELNLVLECGGNGRTQFVPPARASRRWHGGARSCAA